MFTVLSVARGAALECSLIKVPATEEETIFLCCGLTCSDGVIRVNDVNPLKAVTPTAFFVKKQGTWCQRTPRSDTLQYHISTEALEKVNQLFKAAEKQSKVKCIEAVAEFLAKYPVVE